MYTQNKKGQEVPTIPLPFYLYPFFIGRVRCTCGKKFWKEEVYRWHYAYKHVLFYQGEIKYMAKII